jgi:LPXTG-motif cell wall-anchored protein
MSTATRRLVITVLAATLTIAGPAATAYADQPVGVSRDGVAWTPALSAPLFDPGVLWVPGDVQSATFYVRNQATDAGKVWMSVEARDDDQLLAHEDIKISVRRDGGAWADLRADAASHPVRHSLLRSGSVTQIDVRAVLERASPNRSQQSALALRFTVGLTEAVGSVSGPHDGNGPGGLLPDTGGVTFWVLALGVLLLLSGFGTVLVGARRRDDDEEIGP